MRPEQLTRIKSYVKVINHGVKGVDGNLFRYTIEEVVDRVLLYLNDTALDPRLERVVARIISGVFTQTKEALKTGETAREISAISDNGQSISYSDRVKSYLVSSEDTELFGGFAKLLAPYRRVCVSSR